jgi:hypothetical protein
MVIFYYKINEMYYKQIKNSKINSVKFLLIKRKEEDK